MSKLCYNEKIKAEGENALSTEYQLINTAVLTDGASLTQRLGGAGFCVLWSNIQSI